MNFSKIKIQNEKVKLQFEFLTIDWGLWKVMCDVEIMRWEAASVKNGWSVRESLLMFEKECGSFSSQRHRQTVRVNR